MQPGLGAASNLGCSPAQGRAGVLRSQPGLPWGCPLAAATPFRIAVFQRGHLAMCALLWGSHLGGAAVGSGRATDAAQPPAVQGQAGFPLVASGGFRQAMYFQCLVCSFAEWGQYRQCGFPSLSPRDRFELRLCRSPARFQNPAPSPSGCPRGGRSAPGWGGSRLCWVAGVLGSEWLLCPQIQHTEDMENEIDELLQEFEEKSGRAFLHTVCFY